ncbi:MAG: peptidylprolyl isomerase [Planctomycetota bacterium]
MASRTLRAPLLASTLTLALIACGKSAPPEGGVEREAASNASPGRFAPGGPIADDALGAYHVTLACAVEGEDVGTMAFELWSDRVPATARNFLRLVDEGFYDEMPFHRVLRDFMAQSGDTSGIGVGGSPHGNIVGEFSTAPDRAHGYGVLSMARMGSDPNSASAQFFICCDESQLVWNLDGSYASFGRLTKGVATLEAIANVPVRPSRNGEPSRPTVSVVISDAEVRDGPAPTGDTIERPLQPVDLGGAPERVVLQACVVTFAGRGTPGVTRSRDEAKDLAERLLADAQGGADMDALVREHSDEPIGDNDPTPGTFTLLNEGVRDRKNERAVYDLGKKFKTEISLLMKQRKSEELSAEDYTVQRKAIQVRGEQEIRELLQLPRGQYFPAVADAGFALDVGEVTLVPFDQANSPLGFYVLRRLE